MAEITLTGHEPHDIDLPEAARLTANYRRTVPEDAKKGGYFGEDAILELLAQKDCIGFRYYYGLDDDGKQVLVLVGVKPDGNDIIDGRILERSWPCPNICSGSNVLNSD
jgi:hypothetical protein